MALTPDVVDGGIIETAWGNEIRNRSVQVFATQAERDSQWLTPPNGAMAFTTDTNTVWQRVAGAWVQRSGLLSAGAAQSGDINFTATGQVKTIAAFNFPATAFASIIVATTCFFVGFGTGAITAHAALNIAGNQVVGKVINAPASQWVSCSLTHAASIGTVAASANVDVALDSGPNAYVNGFTTWTRIGPA